MTKLRRYADEAGLRLIDLFKQFDKDKSWTVDREEFVMGIKVRGNPPQTPQNKPTVLCKFTATAFENPAHFDHCSSPTSHCLRQKLTNSSTVWTKTETARLTTGTAAPQSVCSCHALSNGFITFCQFNPKIISSRELQDGDHENRQEKIKVRAWKKENQTEGDPDLD